MPRKAHNVNVVIETEKKKSTGGAEGGMKSPGGCGGGKKSPGGGGGGKNYKIVKKYRYDKFKLYFHELEALLPYSKSSKSKNTQKNILLDTVAYIKALEIELGIIQQNIDWEHHYETLMQCLDQNEAEDADDDDAISNDGKDDDVISNVEKENQIFLKGQ